VNWAQDVYPEVAGKKKIRIAQGVMGLAMRVLRTCSLRLAAVNVVLGERMARRMRGLRGASRVSVEIIHNWANGDAVVPVANAMNPLRESWDLAGKFVLEYSGNMGQVHEFETMLGAAERLANRHEIVFLFIGGGFHRGWIEHEARTRNLSNVRFKPYQPRDQLSRSLGVADVHLTSLLPSMEGLIVPSKIYGILAAGRPTLHVGAPDGEIAAILESAKAGFTVPPGDSALLAQRILEFASDPALGTALGLNARRAFESSYNQRIAYSHWARVLLNVDAKALG
jgi:glycosyltransferase involved in cell wall biosynthesis